MTILKSPIVAGVFVGLAVAFFTPYRIVDWQWWVIVVVAGLPFFLYSLRGSPAPEIVVLCNAFMRECDFVRVEWDGKEITAFAELTGEPFGRFEFSSGTKTYFSFVFLEQSCSGLAPFSLNLDAAK